MTNYEELMGNMSPELLADLTTQLVSVNNERLFYLTSTGQLFPQSQHEDAIRFQYNWLMSASPNTPVEVPVEEPTFVPAYDRNPDEDEIEVEQPEMPESDKKKK